VLCYTILERACCGLFKMGRHMRVAQKIQPQDASECENGKMCVGENTIFAKIENRLDS